MHPSSKEDQQVKGGDVSFLFSLGGATPEELSPLLGCLGRDVDVMERVC